MKTRYLQLVFLVFLSVTAMAQDPQYSQFYAAPLYHNPAFAGSSFRDRVVFNYRNQWPAIPGAFVNYAASYDHYFSKYNSGFGVLLSNSKAGSGELQSFNGAAMYSYQLALSQEWGMRAGIQFGAGHRSLNFYRLTFSDQLNEQGIPLQTQDPSATAYRPVTYFDAGAGLLVYSKKYWIGVASHHMNQPDQSLTETASPLPMRLTVNAGMRIALERPDGRRRSINYGEPDKTFSPVLLYRHQGGFNQLDLGGYLYYSPMVVGLWYRGLPVLNYKRGFYNHDAVILLVGFKLPNISFGYSYDLTVSRLSPATGGAHEISLSYEFDTKVKFKKRHRPIPCPRF
jgi:type IX secretion system PorP/SprF family membrane protein